MHAPFSNRMHQEPETTKPPKTSGGHESGDFASESSVPRIERLIAQGTVASPGPVAGADVNRLAPDARRELITRVALPHDLSDSYGTATIDAFRTRETNIASRNGGGIYVIQGKEHASDNVAVLGIPQCWMRREQR